MASFSALTNSVNPLFTQSLQNNTSSSSHHIHCSYGGQVNPIVQTRISTPDLTTSPTSSTSSISSAFDERWPTPSEQSLPRSLTSWADLNPRAQPFVPGSLLMHNPILFKDQLNAQLLASVPVDYLEDTGDGLPDFKLAPLSDWDTFSEEPLKLLEKDPHLPSTPTYPPGFQLPPTSLLKDLLPPAVPPSYLPLIANCLRRGTLDYEIEAYSRVIIASHPRWELEDLIELAERICFEMYNPCASPDGRIITACDFARYIPVDPTGFISNGFFVEYERGAQRQHAIAIMVKHLNQHLSIIQNAEAAHLFMWNLRESALARFRETWDIEIMKDRALSLLKPGTPYDVCSALTLCKSIASLFNQKLIMSQHITMCINILFKHLMSVEHVEAITLLVLGCGPALWDASTFTPTALGIGLYANGPHQPPRCTADLVQAFLVALFTSVNNFSVHDSKSLVFPRAVWGAGQLMMRLNQIEIAVKDWEVLLSRSPNLRGPMGDVRNDSDTAWFLSMDHAPSWRQNFLDQSQD